MKKAELHRKYADALELCEKHNVPVCQSFKFDGNYVGFLPTFTEYLDDYTFPLAVVEGKPVFVGDKLYNVDGTFAEILCNMSDPELFAKKHSWNPPTPIKPKTFMLNGTKVPCPSIEPGGYVLFIDNTNFYFRNRADSDRVKKYIFDLLDGK
jgi:hypothetical protein